FSWVFFLRTKDETSGILKDFIRQIENQLNQKVKTIRCDNGTEFKNRDVIEFCGLKGIKREYSNARTPQQNGVAERKNRTLIEAARTMLADSFLPNTFWAEAVSTACYVLNRVLVTKPHNKTPYELLTGKLPIISYIRPFGCHVTILNTIDHMGKFAGKSDEGFLVGYSLQSKAFRVYNLETKRVEENLHITFLENKPNVAGKGPTWLFDLDYLTDSMNYHPVRSENQANHHAGQQEANHHAGQQEANQNAGTEDILNGGDSEKEDESAQDCYVLPIWPSYSSTITPALKLADKREGPREDEQVFMDELERLKRQEKEANEEAEALRKKFENFKKIKEEDESESESDGIPETKKKFKQLESDEEMARKIQEEWEGEKERNRIAEEKATNEALIRNFDDINARIEAERLLAEKLQEQEREQFTIEERAKFLHDTIAAQRKFLAQQRSEAIRNRPPTKNQLRNQMMTYLKHVGNFKHSDLKIKKFEEIQVLYEKIKRFDEDFISIGSAEDERLIKKINEKGVDSSKGEKIKVENKEEVKEENTGEESTRKRKQDEEKEVDYEILDMKYPIKEWKTECFGTKPQANEAECIEEINQNVVIRSNGQKRYFSTLVRVLSIFDREDLNAVYQLVMDRFQDEIPEGFDRIIVSWKLHSSSGVHTLVTETGLVIHMLIEKKYPLKKEVLVQMLKLKLESEKDSTMALELIRFIKKLLAKLEPEE
ncbi:ribonuclease H-like domain-containing protein, partial [Tanacetum coccineum]